MYVATVSHPRPFEKQISQTNRHQPRETRPVSVNLIPAAQSRTSSVAAYASGDRARGFNEAAYGAAASYRRSPGRDLAYAASSIGQSVPHPLSLPDKAFLHLRHRLSS